MSNIANTIKYLNTDPSRFIRITQQDNEKIIGKNDVYLTDIPNGNLEEYIRFNLGPITKPTLVWVEMRSKKGATSRKDHTCGIEISPINYPEPQQSQPQQPQAMSQLPVIQQEPVSIPNFLGSPGQGNIFGLGFAEVVGMQVKADRLSHKEEQLADLKDDFKELKQKYNLLEISHRETLTKLSVAEAQKDMAVMMAKLENKSFADSPAFEKIMDNAPQFLQAFISMKSGAVIPVQASLNAPAVSETHSELIEFINANMNENQVNFLGSVCRFINNENFVNQLKTLITQYAQV